MALSGTEAGCCSRCWP